MKSRNIEERKDVKINLIKKESNERGTDVMYTLGVVY